MKQSKFRRGLFVCGFILILGAVVTGCGAKYAWTTGDKVALGAMIVAKSADVITTINNLNDGMVETTSLYGRHPDTAMLIGSQILLTGIWAWAAQYIMSDLRKVLFGFPAVIHGMAAYDNYKLSNE